MPSLCRGKDDKSEFGPREAHEFRFCIVSKGRPENVEGIQKQLVAAPNVTWFVGEGEKELYTKAGARSVVEGGGLCKSRNAALDMTAKEGKVCVQISDDVEGIKFLHLAREWDAKRGGEAAGGWEKPESLTHANSIAKKGELRALTLLGAARVIDSLSRRRQARLGGCYPTPNTGQAMCSEPVKPEHFIVGDFIVVQPPAAGEEASAAPRFDEEMTLKEDYDFTATHLRTYGVVARCCRIIMYALHYTNAGGAVAVRTTSRELSNIRHLRQKWPGVFINSPRGPTEVVMRWELRDVTLGGRRDFIEQQKQRGRSQRRGRKRKRHPIVAKAADELPPVDLAKLREGVADLGEWHLEGTDYIGHRIARSTSMTKFSYGAVIGWLPAEYSDFKPEGSEEHAPLYRIRFDVGDLEGDVEDLELYELAESLCLAKADAEAHAAEASEVCESDSDDDDSVSDPDE